MTRPGWRLVNGTSIAKTNYPRMPRYFFHLAGQLKANDLLGHDCIDDREARDHASFIAHRIGTEKPQMVRDGNFIRVTNDAGVEIDRVPLASTTV